MLTKEGLKKEGSNVCRRLNQRHPKRINKVGYSSNRDGMASKALI